MIAEKRRTDGTVVTLLEHHLRQYTRRNTSDFFIHKDLKGFLSRELDFYLKNEVLNLEEMEAAGQRLAEGWFQLMRLIKRVGLIIIEFLAQIENFQKMLWEKKKFITETFYIITLGNVPEVFYPDIADNAAQWEEWDRLLAIESRPQDLFSGNWRTPEGRVAFLKAHPSLPLDTRHFPPDFTDRLLASFDDLDEMTDGLLVHSENWQALNLLKEKYRERVKCVYIDPPYNTGSDGFLYRDNYQHSSWLAMMSDRLEQGTLMMTGDSAIFASIGNDESSHLRLLMVGTLGKNNFRSTVIYRRGIKSVQAQFDTVDKLNQGYDFLLMASKNEGTRFSKLMVPKSLEDEDENEKAEPQGSWNNHCRGTDRPSMRYPLFGITPSSGQWRWGRERSEKAIENYKRMCLELGTDNPSQAQIDEWIRKKDEAGEYLDLLRLSANGTPEHYVRPSSVKLSSDLWTDLKPNGSHQVGSLFGTKVFENPKSTNLVERVIRFVGNDDSMVLDYFAGSGTTGHAVINLNREDGGRRKFILVEMADYFDTVLLPRLKKVTFSPEWKEGKPKRVATAEEAERGPRIIKIIRLESYEDALNNLLPSEESGGQVAMQFEDYLLKYMLQWETRKSETLLNVEKLSKPFDYCLHIYRDGETRVQKVDLPETFNYLIGLDVAKRQLLDDNGRYYLVYRGVTRDGKSTVVIWRETAGWTEEDYKSDRDFVAKHKFTEGADVIYVNGDSLIPGAQALEGVFKAKMFAGVEG